MSDKSLTFLEIHLGDGDVQLGPKSFGVGDGDADDAAASADAGETGGADESSTGRRCPCPRCGDGCDCAGCKVGKLLFVVGVVAGIAALAWKLLGETDLDAAEELDELAE